MRMIHHSHRQARPMRFVPVVPPKGFETPCYVCVSHAYNADGYLYKAWKDEALGRKVREPFYRLMLQAKMGWDHWPEGLEANHKCGNRGCNNPAHLQALGRSDHKAVTNSERYADRNETARLHWMVYGSTGTELAERFGVSVSCACRWIRQWNAEDEGE